MIRVVCLDGQVMPAAEAKVSVLDRGFLYGDSVYEVLRTFQGRLVFWREHEARLRTSAGLIGFDLGASEAVLRAESHAALAAMEGQDEAYLRLIVTRGLDVADPRAWPAPQPTRVIIVQPLPRVPAVLYREGCALATFPTGRQDEGGLDPRLKSGNTLLAQLAKTHAQQRGAYEALRIDPLGRILEGSSSTFFVVSEGRLCTPPLGVGILPGITRAKVLELAPEALGVAVDEVELTLDDLGPGCEAFITSSTRGVVPVRAIDALALGDPGPTTRRMMTAYDTLMAEDSLAWGGHA